ncbi:MAG: gamma-butyrobetaine hydroxylase-like domain-containing protein [Gammaproteobacteria bacterium]
MATHVPTNLVLHQQSRVLEVSFEDGTTFRLPCEYLRVYSPSAEVRGHGPGQGTLQVGKEHVNINDIEPVGNYAVRLVFDDGHDSGLYTWDYLHLLGRQYDVKWREYLAALHDAGHARDAGDGHG